MQLYPAIAPKFLAGETREEALEASETKSNGKAAPMPTEFRVEVDGDEFNVKILRQTAVWL